MNVPVITSPSRTMAVIGSLRRRAMLVVLALIIVGAVIPAAAGATAITEFPLPAGSDPFGVTPGPDGNVWFTDGGPGHHAIGKITPSGTITEFTVGLTSAGYPDEITNGPDGNLWFTATGSPPNAIGKVTPSGTISEVLAGTGGLNANSAPSALTVGPDGNLWFLDDGSTPRAIGRITPAGSVTEFNMPHPNSQLEDLTVGPDGNLWFTDKGDTKAVGRVTPAGVITEFTVPLDQLQSRPTSITAGGDGNLWFTDPGNPSEVGRATPSGTITEFTTGLQPNTQPDATTAGPDGNVWFEDNYSGQRAVGRIKPDGAINEFTSGLNANAQDDITVGSDGNMWVEQASPGTSAPGGIARITPAGVITEFTSGLLPKAGQDGDGFATGPDGNLWFNDRGAKAIGMVSIVAPSVSTGPASAITSSSATVSGTVNPRGAATTVSFEYGTTPALGQTASAGTLPASGDASPVSAGLSGLPAGTLVYYRVVATNGSGTAEGTVQTFTTSATPPPPPPPPKVTVATVGNQRITLTIPGTCATKAGGLRATLASRAIPHSRAAKLHFLSAAFYLDRGVKHKRHKTKRLRNGKKKIVTVVVYVPNRTVHHLPATVVLRVAGLRSGTHTLSVVLTYSKRVTRHRHRVTVKVSKRLKVKFAVC